jgi:hypothetical protein
MTPNLLFYQLLLVALVLICIVIHVWWPDPSRATPPRPLTLDPPRRKRSKEPKPFTGGPDHIKVNTFGKPYLPTLLAMKLD